MPLFSEHISNMYYSGTPSYNSAPSYSYSAPLGMSYSASYLNPGSHYSKHSSLGSYGRAPVTPRWTSAAGRTYNPILSTISERSTSSPVRISSPRRMHVPKRTYALSTYTPRPIHINTADIDVSRDRYRPSLDPAPAPAPAAPLPTAVEPSPNDVVPSDPTESPMVDNGPFMPRVDGKPETGIDTSPGVYQRSTIKRGRTVVRLHTVKRKDRDSPRKPVDSAVEYTQTGECIIDELPPEPEATVGWREKLSEDLVYVDKREKKTLGAKLVEKFILKDKDDEGDLVSLRKDYLNKKDDEAEEVLESLLPPVDTIPASNKSPDRRCSMELLTEQANLLDSLIRSENLSMATLDLTKVGIGEDSKTDQKEMQASIKRRKFCDGKNPLQTTKSDHSIDRMKSLRDSRDKHFSKRRSLKKSASGGSLRRLDSITEFPRELTAPRNLPSIEESRQSIKNGSVKEKPESIDDTPKTVNETDKTEAIKDKPGSTVEVPPTSEIMPLKKEEIKEKPKLKAKITSTVEVSPPKSPIKFIVDNVTVEEKLNSPKKEISYSSKIEEAPKKIAPNTDNYSKPTRAEAELRLKPETLDSDTDSPSPEPDDGNFWSKIGKRETVYLMKRKQNIQENLAKSRRALFWFPEDDEEQPPDASIDSVGDSKAPEQDVMGESHMDQTKKVPVTNIVDNVEAKVEKKEVKVESIPVVEKNKELKVTTEAILKDVQDMAKKKETPSEIEKKDTTRIKISTLLSEAKADIEKTVNNTEISKAEKPLVESEVPTVNTVINDPKKITSAILPASKVNVTKTILPETIPKIDINTPIKKESANSSAKISELPRSSNLSKNKSLDQIIPKSKLLEKPSVELNKSASAQDLKSNVAAADKFSSTSEIKRDAIAMSQPVTTSCNRDGKDVLDEELKSSIASKTEDVKLTPQVSKIAKTEAKPKSKKAGEKVIKKKEKTPPGTCVDCKKPLPKSSPPKQVTAPNQQQRDVVRKATASIKSKDLDVRRFLEEQPKKTATAPPEKEEKQSEKPIIPTLEQSGNELKESTEALSIPIVVQSENQDIPKTQIEVTKEPTEVASTGEGNKAESVPPTNTGNILKVDKPVPAKLTPKKPVKQEAPLKPMIATPRPLQKKKPPQVIQSSSSSESSSEEESSDEEESDSSEGSGEFFECENNPDGRTSTGSNDSGFDSSAPTSPAGFVHIKKDCDVNCHRKCEKLTANLCGVNQRLLVEALATRTASKRGGDTAGPSASSAPSAEPASDVLLDELESSTAYSLFRKTGRFTPPARSIPRFRKYNIDDFHFIKVLGKGSFGKVLLTELRDTEYYYAVKCLKKDVVLEDDDVECTLIERKVLALGTNHPYLCHLFATFQTDSHLFFVMEYLNGGDLMFHIQQSGRFPESRARFYAAEIVSGLKFLHKRGIVYRDLKLDNILLDYEGHVRIADFGMCKLQIFLDKTADTFCGTPDYMAPEIIKGLKYTQTVDWWSFGVLLYEMLIGQSPFSGCDEDELFWSICNEMPSYPRFLSQEALSILTRLLDKDARTRLGGMDCMHGDVRDQEFFHSINWDRLDRRELETPFKPRVRHPLDTQYFDRVFTGERPRLTAVEPQVLRSMDQEPFRGFSYTNPNATDR